MQEPLSTSSSKGTQTPMETHNVTNHGQTRQALQILPAVPLNKRPPPITSASSPPKSLTAFKSTEPPTPPTTPLQRRHKRSSTSAGSISLERVSEEGSAVDVLKLLPEQGMTELSGSTSEEQSWESTTPRIYTKQYRRQAPDSNGSEEFGRGVWSTVYRAVVFTPHPTAPLTPPTSPSSASPSMLNNQVLAVKAPSRRDAYKILDHEARILTYLHSLPKSADYLVPFHGYDLPAHSIILSAIPLSLDTHVKAAAGIARANVSTRTMFDPVTGTKEWSSFAIALISGLSFLHSNYCAHGDIKPANILLQPPHNEGGLYVPLYCDFSSSLVTIDPAPSEITALTQDYSSPELLTSLIDPTRPTLPTFAADIYALAVTLLFAAIGESPYAGARMEVMKLSMAKEGRPLQFAKSGEQAARVRKGGIVERCLTGALSKDVQTRWDVARWEEEAAKVLHV